MEALDPPSRPPPDAPGGNLLRDVRLVVTTCNKSDEIVNRVIQDANNLFQILSNNSGEQAVRTHPDIGFDGHTCCNLQSVTTFVYLRRCNILGAVLRSP